MRQRHSPGERSASPATCKRHGSCGSATGARANLAWQPALAMKMGAHVALAKTGSRNEHHARFTEQPSPAAPVKRVSHLPARLAMDIPRNREHGPMHDNQYLPAGFGVTTPNGSRIYDYYVDGKDNYEADREAARRVPGAAYDAPMAALGNRRAFLQLAIQFLVQIVGIAQFICFGSELSAQGNVYQVTRQHGPRARVLYADNDPVVMARIGWLLRHGLPSGEPYPGGGTRWAYAG